MKYRKKPVVVEAIQLQGNDYSILSVLKFIGEVNEIDASNPFEQDSLHDYIDKIKEGGLVIATLEGEMLASIGDYIIKGVQGEFYPCKPDIFGQTYELVE